MTHDGGGGGDLFDNMTHEQMLQWLDQADGDMIKGAADKLSAAAKTIHDIAHDLKTRPQYVSWKGDGADAFRAWGNDVANATLRLGDFSAGSSQWLARASEAVAGAKAAIPEAPASAGPGSVGKTGNATTKPPDAATLAAHKEALRQEAATQMRKLGQSYQLSATQMDGLERPVFPPVPDAVAPKASLEDMQDLSRPGVSARTSTVGGSTGGSVVRQHGSVSDNIVTPHPRTEPSAHRQPLSEASRIGTDLDSVGMQPKTPQQASPLSNGPTRPEVPPVTGRADPSTTFAPPSWGQASAKPLPTTQDRPSGGPATGGRIPPRQVVGGVPQQRETTSMTPMGRAQNPTRGIVGGCPTQTPADRAANGMSRSPGPGGKGTQKNTSAVGGTGGITRTPVPRSGRPSGQKPGGPKAVPTTTVPSGGETPARGLPPQTTGGVIGSSTTQKEHAGRLPSGSSAPTRGGIAGGVPSKEPCTGTHSASTVAQPDTSMSSQYGEQSQSQQSKKQKQPQRRVTAEPQKKKRPQTD
jgi:uncharacterized protein YukE